MLHSITRRLSTMTQNASKFKIALIQLSVTDDKQKNLQRASQLIHEASQKGASVIALPECFNSPYGTKFFPQYAEKIPGETTDYLSKVAKETKVYLVGGSIPEQDGENYYNTSTVYNPEGEIIAKHRKVHLFDIDVPGKIRFQESEILKPGNQITTFDTKYGRFGLAICYDIRFPELSMLMAKKGCQMLLFPGAFNLTTGPAHWQLLQTARAVDNQVFVAGISPARDEKGSYVAWGHSTVVNPWGQILATTEEKEDIVYADIDFSEIAQFRQSLPITSQKRYDLYSLTDKTEKNVE